MTGISQVESTWFPAPVARMKRNLWRSLLRRRAWSWGRCLYRLTIYDNIRWQWYCQYCILHCMHMPAYWRPLCVWKICLFVMKMTVSNWFLFLIQSFFPGTRNSWEWQSDLAPVVFSNVKQHHVVFRLYILYLKIGEPCLTFLTHSNHSIRVILEYVRVGKRSICPRYTWMRFAEHHSHNPRKSLGMLVLPLDHQRKASHHPFCCCWMLLADFFLNCCWFDCLFFVCLWVFVVLVVVADCCFCCCCCCCLLLLVVGGLICIIVRCSFINVLFGFVCLVGLLFIHSVWNCFVGWRVLVWVWFALWCFACHWTIRPKKRWSARSGGGPRNHQTIRNQTFGKVGSCWKKAQGGWFWAVMRWSTWCQLGTWRWCQGGVVLEKILQEETVDMIHRNAQGWFLIEPSCWTWCDHILYGLAASVIVHSLCMLHCEHLPKIIQDLTPCGFLQKQEPQLSTREPTNNFLVRSETLPSWTFVPVCDRKVSLIVRGMTKRRGPSGFLFFLGCLPNGWIPVSTVHKIQIKSCKNMIRALETGNGPQLSDNWPIKHATTKWPRLTIYNIEFCDPKGWSLDNFQLHQQNIAKPICVWNCYQNCTLEHAVQWRCLIALPYFLALWKVNLYNSPSQSLGQAPQASIPSWPPDRRPSIQWAVAGSDPTKSRPIEVEDMDAETKVWRQGPAPHCRRRHHHHQF